ncbi:helix-turn-helix transcriptional regulator [Natribaculum luteum]|uniref:Helix-turn-helix transcriptional regulator n=1 Tax=Natribaculum luteum TaxID=1586232 RepID=A0ABD5NY26_9EURY|nr:MarR family transcriptional regulator [Natribaculum luteum]
MSKKPDRDIGFLAGSPVRTSLIERLTTGPAQPADLVAHTGSSRTTVHRTLNELVDRGWVRRVDDGYAITGTGDLALETYQDARRRFRTLDRFEAFLEGVDDAPEIELEWLEGARLETESDENPHRPIERYADGLATADGEEFYGVTPVITRQFIDVHEPIIRGETTVKLVISNATLRAVADQYPRQLRESLEFDNYELYATDETPSMGTTIYGERVFLGAYDDRRRLVAVVESTDPDLRAWATDCYQRLRESATRVTADAAITSD